MTLVAGLPLAAQARVAQDDTLTRLQATKVLVMGQYEDLTFVPVHRVLRIRAAFCSNRLRKRSTSFMNCQAHRKNARMTRIDASTVQEGTWNDATIADARTTAEQRRHIETQVRAALDDLRTAFGHDLTGTWPQFQVRYRTEAETREAFPRSGGATAAWVPYNMNDVININVDHPDLKTADVRVLDHVLKHELLHGLTDAFFKTVKLDEVGGKNKTAFQEAWFYTGQDRMPTNVPLVLQEGLTEYFARQRSGFQGGLSKDYDGYARLATQLVERVGEATTRQAFFGNDQQAYKKLATAAIWLARKSALDQLPSEISLNQPTRPGLSDIHRLVLQQQLGLSSPLLERVRAVVGSAGIERAASFEEADLSAVRDALVKIVGRPYDEAR